MEGNACSLCGWGNSTSNGHVAVIIAIDSDVAALRVETLPSEVVPVMVPLMSAMRLGLSLVGTPL